MVLIFGGLDCSLNSCAKATGFYKLCHGGYALHIFKGFERMGSPWHDSADCLHIHFWEDRYPSEAILS